MKPTELKMPNGKMPQTITMSQPQFNLDCTLSRVEGALTGLGMDDAKARTMMQQLVQAINNYKWETPSMPQPEMVEKVITEKEECEKMAAEAQ